MNYLILTPDGVGSTILQRLLTMAFHIKGQNCTNTDEITYGLELNELNCLRKNPELVQKQTLDNITKILKSHDKNINLISRCAKHHFDDYVKIIKPSNKSIKNYYNFLTDFFPKKIMCIRKNIFEYALSWSIKQKTGFNNVYTRENKKKLLSITSVNETFFLKKCNEYVNYVYWIEENFSNLITVAYEDLITNTDKVIEDLIGYKNVFIDQFKLPLNDILKIEYDYVNGKNIEKPKLKTLLLYKKQSEKIIKKQDMLAIPIKSMSLLDKKNQIQNFNNCLDIFHKFAKNHNWIDQSIINYDFWNKREIDIDNRS